MPWLHDSQPGPAPRGRISAAPPRKNALDLEKRPEAESASGKTTSQDDKLSRLRHMVQHVLDAPSCGIFLTMLNIANCILIGLETDCRAAQQPLGLCSAGLEIVFLVFEYVFLTVITLELFAQVFVCWRYLFTPWGVFDFLIVAASMFNAVAIQPLYFTVSESTALSKVPGLRIFRLLRLSRSLVRVMRFPELWIMVTGLLGAVRAIAWAFFLGAFIIFTFAVFGVELFASLGLQWSRVGEAMMTLLQVATFDTWALLMRPVIDEYPVTGHIFMISYLVLVGITLMGLITAILTERTLERKERDKCSAASITSKDLQDSQDNLRQYWDKIDITKEELARLWENDAGARQKLQRFGTLEELSKLFDFITAGQASVSIAVNFEEFVNHMTQYKKDEDALLGRLSFKQLLVLQRRLHGLEHRMEASQAQLVELSAGASRRCAELAGRLQDEQEAMKCKDDAQRAEWLGRLGLRTVDVTALRHVFEAEDRTGRGELDFEGFASFFPNADPDTISSLWNDAAVQNGSRICLDEFLTVVSRDSAQKLLQSASSRHEPRPLCTPMEASKDAVALAVRAAEEVVGQLSAEKTANDRLAAERMAEHAAERAAERTADLMTESVVERLSQRVLERLVQRAGVCAAAEASAQFESLSAKVTSELEGACSALRSAWAEHTATTVGSAPSLSVLPEEFSELLRAVQRPHRESAATQTEGLESDEARKQAHPPSQVEQATAMTPVAASGGAHARFPGMENAAPISVRHLHQGQVVGRESHHAQLGGRSRPAPLQLDDHISAASQAAMTPQMWMPRNVDSLRTTAMQNAYKEAHPLLMDHVTSPLQPPLSPQHTYFSPLHSPLKEQPSFTPSRRPCLLQQMENLAHQVSHLEIPGSPTHR